MKFREIGLIDISAIFSIRLATDENKFTYEELVQHGISHESVRNKLLTTCKGWLCETNNMEVGFIIADKSSGEIWLLAVLPQYINKKIGSQLLNIAENWLISEGHKRLWLITDPDKNLRAYSFYLKNGWLERKIENGILYMEKAID
ncbi:GNAT family N-acetyltransferase [Maribellus sp. CM-23]|uniref:GNAT family N-acetyltransferase n=1 Tax=Maribellus sp. CM-23 TaxID=2781026 RepID=UPI001F1C2CBF|nr:GNAT family N-acetyltransferase [Maribellus sp. CM-23]MCE4563417.1 GNAT family N-acetyltransferase [Maribellus sp. CM-23]